ncbi:hypothetical protein F2Q70_00022189 [Brassica cretica]|uniref:Uncharacterized protein n=1 Tax=Brassica cretica TaxID=69181 RepID=A0A8S9GPE7_BRACR|nr:hypothetical protein F2Q70_00022189 [Brassica cretica]
MAFVGSESLDHHPPPSPSVHGHHLPDVKLLLDKELWSQVENRMRNQGKSPSFSLLLHKGLNRMGKPQWFGFELKCELWTCGSFSSGSDEPGSDTI